MWPFSEMSLSAASLVGTIANWVLLASLIGGLLSTFVIVKTTDVKEEHWAEDRRKSNEKIADLGARRDEARAELGVAQADIAKANAQAALQEKETAKARQAIVEANARTKEAELKLEQLRRDLGPRQFLRDPFIKEVTGQPSARVEVMYLQDDPECFGLAQRIWQALENGKWPVEVPKPIPPLLIANFPTAMSVGGQPSGVTVVAGGITQAEADAQMNALQGKEWIKTPWTVLMHALGEALGKIGGSAGGVSPPTQGWLRVVVSPRI
jgi:hypothetical protein